MGGHGVARGARGGAGKNHWEHRHEKEKGGKKTAGSRNAQRTENVVEKNFGAILDAAHTAWPIARMLRLSGRNLDADGEIRRRKIFGHARKHDRQFSEAFQLFAANVTGFQVLPDLSTLFNARSAGDGIIEIARQIGSYCIALHWTPLPVELAHG